MAFALQFLTAWVPSVSQLLKLALSSRALPCVNERPFPCYLSCLDVRELVKKDSGAVLLTPS